MGARADPGATAFSAAAAPGLRWLVFTSAELVPKPLARGTRLRVVYAEADVVDEAGAGAPETVLAMAITDP